MNELSDIVNETLGEVRRIARGLRPSVLDHLGPIQALEQYLDDFRASHPQKVTLHVEHFSPEERWSPKVEITTYRVIQECLTNVARHARAKHVEIRLSGQSGMLHVSVRDDGCGFATMPAGKSTMGLRGMAERVALLHGIFQVESNPGQGTRVSFSLPL
jgi:signal transduction histidine kinase